MMQGISDNKTNAKINDKRARRGGSPKQRRLFSFTVSTLLVLSTLLLSISTQIPNASAGTVTHNVGELQVRMLTDHGRIWMPLQWPKTGTLQTAGNSGWGYMGLVVDQDGYDHNPGSVDIADCYKSAAQNYMQQDDFGVLSSIDMIIDDGNSQKSKATFQNIGTTQDANDILINQTCWTVKDKDWAILQWRVVNIKTPAADITGFCLGLEVDISHATASYGLGGDPGDEIDGYDAQDDIYWAQDDKGTTLGFGSAIAQDPITHYYSKDYHPADYDEYKTYWEDETWLYERLHAANNTVGASPGNRTTTVGWNQVNIPAGSSRTFTLVIAINSSFDEMKTAFEDAQYYYHTVASGFRITEFSDASSAQQRVEVFNFGRRTTDLNAKGYFLSVDGGTTKLVGNWDTNPLQSYEYAVFTLDPGENIGPEGGSLGLYQDLGAGDIVHVDSVSFGIFGPAPDPLLGESTARIWSDSQAEYIGKWTRASTPSFGEKNIVPHINPDPEVVLNEVMFYPSVNDGGYITIYNKMNHNVSLKDFYVVCDTVYQLSGLGDIILEPSQTYIIRHSDNPALFDNMAPSGDNVYLYDSAGSLLDMVGWNTPHLQGMSVCRTPSSGGTYSGYNDATSEAAGWIFNTPLEVLITEISDAESSQSKIEVYNPWYPPINMNVGFGFTTDSGTLDGTWSIWEVDSGEYAVLDVTTILGLNPEGDTLTLYQYGFFIDEISYGQKGIVPDPLPNESVQRYWDGTVYTDVWERNYTTGTTFGSENDVPPLNISSKLRLNEILFNPTTKTDAFIELILLFGRIDISGYKIVGDSEYIIPQGTELIPGDDIFYLVYSDDSDFFDALNPQGDNVYLYDANGSLVDMAGWSSLHTKGKSMNRIPEGNGTRDGYDDSSSRAAGWVFDCLPSIQYVKAYTIEPKKYGPFGDVIYFDVTVTNKQQVSDTVLLFTSSLYGYPAVIFDETRTHYISEVFLQAGSSVNISILVILPSEVPLVDTDNISITVQSDNITMYRDTIIIQAIVTPFVWPEKSISPSEIYYSGTGYDEVTTITLNLTGYGSVIEFVQPQDVIFCVDTSGSMTSQAIELIKQGLFGYVDEMRPQDRGAVVIFNSGAWLVNPLTNDHNALRNDIFGIPGPGGSTFMGEALKVAIDELLANGNESHIHVIILLTDGGWNGLMDPVVQAERAAAHNIIIFTIGLEPAPPNRLDEPTLREIADITGGQYFYAQDANQIPDIYKIIAKYIGDIAGRDIDVLDANPMIRDVLPPWIILVDNSFSIEPDINYVDETGYRILEWNLSSIFIGEIWEVTFQVKSTKLGQVHTNDLHNSRISYVDYFDMEYVRLFPECTAIVLPPRPLPPKLYIDLLPNEDDILLYWDKSPTPGIDHYLLYQAESPTGFDFSSPWINTSVDIDPLDTRPKPGPVGNRLSWNHTNAQDPATPQYYYCIRAVNILYQTSFTSRTVGKWTKTFLQGVSTFSLPLEPLEIMTPTADFFLMDMNADYIKWVNPTTHFWMKHGEGEVNDVLLEVGSGYEVAFPTATDYTFLGMPGAMIRHKDGEFSGFDYNSDARSLWAVASPATGDVMLSWDEPDDMDPNGGYNVYFATTRDGFDDGTATFLTFVPASARKTVTHFNAAQPGSQHYYMVVPVNESAGEGASTYSVGVFCAFYQAEYDTLAIPLRISMDYNADWFCDNIPDCVGINYYDMGEQRWNWHSKRMPEGAYDTNLVMTEGYQISTAADTKYTFVGH